MTQTVEAKGFKIPIVGLGTWALRDVTRVVSEAIRVGYRHIDTAQMYGNEAEVGEAVRASGLRSEIMVTTKIQPTNLAPRDVVARSIHAEILKRGILDAFERLPPWKRRLVGRARARPATPANPPEKRG